MKPIHLGWLILALAVMFFFHTAFAYGFRCGTRLISVGDSKFRVLSRCGEPTHIETWEEERILRDFRSPKYADEETPYSREPLFVKQHVTIERWTYNRGALKLIRYLTFENGFLVKITTGEHGY